jgi:hypothetical protein
VTTSKRLLILDGPDGGGKSTIAKAMVANGWHYVHCGAYPGVKRGLGRLYVEAMAPALLGLQDTVLDRCWFDEAIYGAAFRGGADRLNHAFRRMLDRVAARCETAVYLCLPPVETCLATFRSRRGVEYLQKEEQLREVWRGFANAHADGDLTNLPTVLRDYTSRKPIQVPRPTYPHDVEARSAGFLDAPVVIVGEGFAERRDFDPLFQAPFVAFDHAGCSAWLTWELIKAGVPERALLWVNADDPQLDRVIEADIKKRRLIVTLGAKAHARIAGNWSRVQMLSSVHPQAAKRFGRPFDVAREIKEAL